MAKKMSPEQLEKMRLGREAKKKANEVKLEDGAEKAMTELLMKNVAAPLEPEVMEKFHEKLETERRIEKANEPLVKQFEQDIVDDVNKKIIEEIKDQIDLTESALNNLEFTLPELDSEIISVIETMENMEEKLNDKLMEKPEKMEEIVKNELEKINDLESEIEKKVEEIEEKIKPQKRMTYNQMFGSMWNGINW